MRRIYLVITIIVFLCCVQSLFASAPGKVRGFSWSTHIQVHPELELIKDNGRVKEYVNPEEDLELGGITIDKVTYFFFMDRFYGLEIEFSDSENADKLVSVLANKYGKHRVQQKSVIKKRLWKWSNVFILYEFNVNLETGKVSYYYRSTYKQAMKELQKTVDAEDAF